MLYFNSERNIHYPNWEEDRLKAKGRLTFQTRKKRHFNLQADNIKIDFTCLLGW